MKRLVIGVGVAAALAGACGGSQQQTSKPASTPAASQAATPAPADAKVFHLEGKIVALKPDVNALSIDGKDVPGFMSAMTMDYAVKSKDSLAGLSAGDEITADVIVTTSEPPYVQNIKVTKKAGA